MSPSDAPSLASTGIDPDASARAAVPAPVQSGRGTPEADGSAPRVPVGPGPTVRQARATVQYPVTDPPMRVSKVQPPRLREEVLSRARLLDWLDIKIHRRVVTIVAEAGYGKTTLLADWTWRTRMRVVWHQLDEDDRDIVVFIRYLLAACRRVAPEMGETTAGLLRDIGTLATSAETLADTLIRELGAMADQPTVLIFDDVHSIERAPEVQRALREIIARAPDRMTIVLSGRRKPPVPLARLRTHGEIAELAADDLRFDHEETETLFRDAYNHPLDRESLATLERRTQGWAASLDLVRAAIRDRSDADTRRFIRGLSAAEGPLYDYLAEEVVSDLTPDLQSFLMRTALLVDVDIEPAMIAADVDRATAQERITEAERLGLLSIGRGRAGRSGAQYHPLVREFLAARLVREIGEEETRAIHRRIAAASEETDWRRAVHHYAEADDVEDLQRVLVSATRSIMASGDYSYAESYISRSATTEETPWFDIILSRRELRAGRVTEAIDRAERAVASLQEAGPDRHLALANLISMRLNQGDVVAAHMVADELESTGSDGELNSMAAATRAIIETSQSGRIADAIRHFERLSASHSEEDTARFRGVTLLNLAYALVFYGDLDRALETATLAVDTLDADSPTEIANGRLVRATVLAHCGREAEASAELDLAIEVVPEASVAEVLIETADVLGAYGDVDRALELMSSALNSTDAMPAGFKRAVQVIGAHTLARAGKYQEAKLALDSIGPDQLMPMPGARGRIAAIRAHVAAGLGSTDARELAIEAGKVAESVDAHYWARYAGLIGDVCLEDQSLERVLMRRAEADPGLLCLCADLVTRQLGRLSPVARLAVERSADGHKARWRHALRTVIDERSSGGAALPAAEWLDRIGEPEDVLRLRRVVRRLGARAQGLELGRSLARRIAPRVYVEDLGRVELLIDGKPVPGARLRRKVLALLCFLLSRPDFAATRDQTLDALWPEMDPELGSNSLNQTVYFLRRVFEPGYSDDVSAGYVESNSEMVWLDRELTTSRSTTCAELVRRGRGGDREAVNLLARTYRGRFALDFAYEDWAVAHRDSLHAGYLETMERAIAERTQAGDFAGAVELAQSVVEVDLDADAVQLALIRLYRFTGAYAAAGELYAHYAAAQKSEFGVDVPPLADI